MYKALTTTKIVLAVLIVRPFNISSKAKTLIFAWLITNFQSKAKPLRTVQLIGIHLC